MLVNEFVCFLVVESVSHILLLNLNGVKLRDKTNSSYSTVKL